MYVLCINAYKIQQTVLERTIQKKYFDLRHINKINGIYYAIYCKYITYKLK